MITFIIGGARSGKSGFAEKNAVSFKGERAYIATATALDDEMKERIDKHKKERSGKWDTFEEPVEIAPLIKELSGRYDVILLDCLTLWLSNMFQNEANIEGEIEKLTSTLENIKSPIFIVSNETGMGIVPDNPLARKFRDMSGIMNQKVAFVADEVYMVVAGIPMRIK